jgi:predicted amino acid-binding ACT domain protein
VNDKKAEFTGLILLASQDKPEIPDQLLGVLSPFSISILDVQKIQVRGRLIMTILFELDPAHADAIETDLLQFGTDFGHDIAVDFALENESE